jgi:putative transport protein
MSGSSNQLLRQLGLLLFLATVGTTAGGKLGETLSEYGFLLFFIGAVITIIPMLIGALVGHRFLKMNLLTLLGGITGGMTSTPGLGALDSMTDSNAPNVAYATVYPVAMVCVIILAQIIGKL